jgi:hypothetical protein
MRSVVSILCGAQSAAQKHRVSAALLRNYGWYHATEDLILLSAVHTKQVCGGDAGALRRAVTAYEIQAADHRNWTTGECAHCHEQ